MKKSHVDGLEVVTLTGSDCEQHFIIAHPSRSRPLSVFARLAEFVADTGAAIVVQDVFAGARILSDAVRSLGEAFDETQWPVTWMEYPEGAGEHCVGCQAYAVSGISVEPLKQDGQVVGNIFETDWAKYCLLGNIMPSGTSHPHPVQAREVFEKIDSAIRLAGMNFHHVVRTWLYIDRILSWYGEFNHVRSTFFAEQGLPEHRIPASTGVGMSNPLGVSLVANVLAIEPKQEDVLIRTVESPMQCAAQAYGSSFSRAMEVVMSDYRRMYVSGTASIEVEGATAHPGDVDRQIEFTMEVVRGILESRGMSWPDVFRAIAYFKNSNDVPRLSDYFASHDLPPLPVATAHGDICRDDLLFELELDAVVSR
ncbi:MAG: translation initiation inhibitor [Deltaproteobacteria bacterium]|nr:translation initiation inhibitor [Deltaproteobacteria bacterium]